MSSLRRGWGPRLPGLLALVALACGSTSTTPAPDGGGAVPEPKRHRPTAAECDPVRPTTGAPEPSAAGCKSDSECAGDGAARNPRCVFDFLAGKNVCSVDECNVDADCGSARVCACRLAPSFGANRCLAAGCRTDADCGVVGKGWCSPSADGVFANCPLPEPGALGYFCHRPEDECTNDEDCSPAGGQAPLKTCLFSPTKGHFACVALACTK